MTACRATRWRLVQPPSLPHSSRKAASRRRRMAARANAGTGGNLLARAAVGALTEGLRLAGVGAKQYEAAAAAPPAPLLRAGDVAGVLRALRSDFGRQYFVTGQLSDEIYTEDCLYADPTVSFTGRELYKRNLALLVPFLWDAAIELRSLQRLPPGAPAPGEAVAAGASKRSSSDSSSGGSSMQRQASTQQQQPKQAPWWQRLLLLGLTGAARQQGPVRLLAAWRLTCWLRLPWVPYVEVNGTTTYTLNADQNQIVRHVEAWDISAAQALLLLLQPSERAVWRRWGRQQ